MRKFEDRLRERLDDPEFSREWKAQEHKISVAFTAEELDYLTEVLKDFVEYDEELAEMQNDLFDRLFEALKDLRRINKAYAALVREQKAD